MPQAPPAHVSGKLRSGVDLGGVLMAKIQGRRLAEIRTVEELARRGAGGGGAWRPEPGAGSRRACGPFVPPVAHWQVFEVSFQGALSLAAVIHIYPTVGEGF